MESMEVTHNFMGGPTKENFSSIIFFYQNMHNRYKSTERELLQKKPPRPNDELLFVMQLEFIFELILT